MDEIKDLIEQKKKNELSQDDKEKLELIEKLITNDMIFFQLDMQTSYGILKFLGIEDENLSEFYSKLISIDNYSKIPNVYVLDEEMLNTPKENSL